MASGLCIEGVPQIQTVAVFSDHRLSWQKVVEILPTLFLQDTLGCFKPNFMTTLMLADVCVVLLLQVEQWP